MRNTIENFGSKNLLWERVPLDRNLSASECSVMPRAQNTSLRGCKPTMNICRREFQACCLSPTEKFRGPPTHIMLCAHHGNTRQTAQARDELRGESRILKLPGGTRVFTASKGIRGRVELVRT